MPELDTAQAKIVFDNISEKINIGDYETYLSKMQDPANRELFFKSVSEKVNIGDDYNEFEKNITKSTPTATANNLAGATASGKVVPKTETATTTTTTTPKTGYSENITNFVTLYQKDPTAAMQLLPTISEEEIKATPLNSMVKESILKAKKNLELSNTFKEPILQAGVMRGVEVKAKQKEKDVPTLSFASIYKEAEKQKEDITIPYSSQEQTVTPLPKEDILKANLTLINSYLSKGDVDSYNTALKMTKIQAEKYPYLKSYANRLESYIKRKEGDFEGAAKSYDNIEDDSKTISDFNISAYTKVKAGKVEEANEDIDKAIEIGNPSDINDIDDLIYSWQLKGNMAYNAGSTELMEQASSKIKELKYAKDRATKDNVFTIFTKTPLTQEEWDKQYKIVQKNFFNFITSPILGAAEAAGMALQGVYEMSTPPPKDKVYTKEEYDKEKNDRVLLGYSKALNGMVSTAFNIFPSIYAFNVGLGALSEWEKADRNSDYDMIRKQTYIPLEELERAKEEEGVIDTVSKWIFAPLTTAIQTWGDYDSLSETQKNFLGLGDVTASILGLSLAHKGVSALKKNIPPAIEDYIKSQDKFSTDKGVREFRERQAKVEATAEKIKNIDIDKATLDAIMEMKKEAELIVAVMDKINKGEPITEAEGKLVVDFIDQTMKDPEFIIKTFKKEPIQVEKKVDNSVQGNLNRLRTEEANIVNKKEYAGIDDLYKAEEIGNEIAALNEKVNKVIAEKTKAVQEQIDLLKQERKDLYDKEGISNEELLANAEIEADINTRLQPLLKEKQNIINEVYKLDITELDNILKPKEESKPITIDEQIAKTEDIINKDGVTDLTEGGTKQKIEGAIDEVKQDIIDGEEKKDVSTEGVTETTVKEKLKTIPIIDSRGEIVGGYNVLQKDSRTFIYENDFKSELKTKPVEEKQIVQPSPAQIEQPITPTKVLKKPNEKQILDDISNGNIVTFIYKNKSEIPNNLKNKVSSTIEINGKKEIRVTLSKSEADYYLQEKSKTPIETVENEVVTDTTNELIINNLNPTGGLLVDYNPKARMTAKLADNITTLDKTMGGSPDDIITIYRGATKKQKKIVPGDYITTNKELAKSYTGEGNILEMEVRKGDILDDINEPLGEEYIYRPIEAKPTEVKAETKVTEIKKPNISPVTEKYGWSYKETKTGYELYNANGKAIADVTIKGDKYTITDKSGNNLLSGVGKLPESIETVAKDYFYAKERPVVSENQKSTVPPPKVEEVKKSYDVKIEEAKAKIADATDKLMAKWGVKKSLLPEDRTALTDDIKQLLYGLGELTIESAKKIIAEKLKPLFDKLKMSDKDINDIIEEANKPEILKREEIGVAEKVEGIDLAELSELKEKQKNEINSLSKEDRIAYNEFDSLAKEVKLTENIKERASKETITTLTGETPTGNQEYLELSLKENYDKSLKVIDKARDLWGDDYVSKTLEYIKIADLPLQSKSVLYVGLENYLNSQIMMFPENAEMLRKQLNLVYSESQPFQTNLGQAGVIFRIREIAKAKYEIEKVTEDFFSTKQMETRKEIEKGLDASIEDIQKEYENTTIGDLNDKKEITETTPEMTEFIKKMVDKGIQSEIDKIYAKMPSARKVKVDKYIATLDKVQERLRALTYDATIGIPIAVVNTGISIIKGALKGSVKLLDAIDMGIAKMKELNNGKLEKEADIRKIIEETFNADGIRIKEELSRTEKIQLSIERKKIALDNIREQIALKKNELKTLEKPEKGSVEYQRLLEEEKALKTLLNKYVHKETPYVTEKGIKTATNKLVKEIVDINTQIQEKTRKLKEKKESSFENAEIEALKIEKNIRLKTLNIIDPVKTDLIKKALIDSGYGKETTVKTKDGNIKVKVVDWTKLAGEEGSVTKLKQRTEQYLKDNGYSESDIVRISEGMADEYKSYRESIIKKAITKLTSLNTPKARTEQKVAIRRLAELYDYGLFDEKADTYHYLMNNILGISDVSQKTFFRMQNVARGVSELYNTNIGGEKVNEVALNYGLQRMDNSIRKMLREEIINKQDKGIVQYKVARNVQAEVELAQRMMLNTLTQRIQNPLTAKTQLAINKIVDIFDKKSDTPELKAQRKRLMIAIFDDIYLHGGEYYGRTTSQFLNKGMIDDFINGKSDSKTYHAIMSELLSRGHLEATDAIFKYTLTQQYFVKNLLEVMTDKTNPNRMNRKDALNFISESLTGENYKSAEKKAIEVMKHINNVSGEPIYNINPDTIARFADDLVKHSLLKGEKITVEQLKASYEAAYESAGYDLGHEANNFISRQVSRLSGELEAEANIALKEQNYSLAAGLTMKSMFYRNMLNPFVSGGTNWTVLTLQKMGVPISGIKTIKKIDLSTEAGNKALKQTLINNRNAKNTNMRMLIGGTASTLAFIAYKQSGGFDKYKEWLKKNEWAKKYIKLGIPELIIANAYIRGQEGLGRYLSETFSRSIDNNLITKTVDSIVEIVEKGKSTKAGTTLGSVMNLPLPWRMARDIESVYRGIVGKPRDRSETPENFIEGFFKYGFYDYLTKKEGTYQEQKNIEQVEKLSEAKEIKESKELSREYYIKNANKRGIEIPENATIEQAKAIVSKSNYEKKLDVYNDMLIEYTKEELAKKGILEPKEPSTGNGSGRSGKSGKSGKKLKRGK